MKAYYSNRILDFKIPGGTSRGVLTQKETWYLIIKDKDRFGIGECAMFRGLSIDDSEDFEVRLQWVCDHIDRGLPKLMESLQAYPAIRFGLEQAWQSFQADTPFELFPSKFTMGHDSIEINGLIWMGTPDFMKQQIKDKVAAGFSCLKLKIGALDFKEELEILSSIRSEFGSGITIRLDANGAFSPSDAVEKLKALSAFEIHSIEQPIAAGQWSELKDLCASSPIPIALDEELIPILREDAREALLDTVNPAYIILKPSLLGGLQSCSKWIALAQSRGIIWWITSALESNIGLNAIAQWTYTLNTKMPQGLGTGGVFKNNIESPLNIDSGSLNYNPNKTWDSEILEELCT